MSKTTSNKALAKAVLIFGGAQVLTILAALIRSKVAAVTVGATGVGLTALYTSIAGLVNNVCNIGLPDSGVQILSQDYSSGDAERINKTIGLLRIWGVITSVAAIILMIVASPLLCYVYFGSFSSHWHSIIVLSLMPACTIVTSIETTILKSLQQTRRLTLAISLAAILSVVIAVPLYVYWGMDGIIFILVFTAIIVMATTLAISYKANSTGPDFSLLRMGFGALWKESKPMILLGLALVITGIGSMGTDLLLQTYFSTISTLAIVGLFKAGYQLSITYPGMIFTALSNDYYPRLSSLADDVEDRNILVTKQTRVLIAMVTPCIVAFILLLPWIVPLLLSDEFLRIVPMVRIGALSIIARCFALPVCYMPLALGRKWDFVQMELVSYVCLFICVVVGCHINNLTGVGFGIVVSNCLDYLYGYVLCRCKYGFRYKLR